MTDVKSNLYDCKHCGGTGTCSNGPNGSSCLACAKHNELRSWHRKNQYGLVCGTCGGIGQAEPMTERLNKRITPLLALCLAIALVLFVMFSAFLENKHFSEILAFSSAIIGSICGYYFSSQKK